VGRSCSPVHELFTSCLTISEQWILVACVPGVQELSGILAAEASFNPYDSIATFDHSNELDGMLFWFTNNSVGTP